MTTSANSTFNPSVDMVLRQALQLAGVLALGQEPSATTLSHARDMLNVTLKSMSIFVVPLVQLERATGTLTVGSVSFTTPADTLDIDFPMMISSPGSTSEFEVISATYAEYQMLSNKTSTGTPNLCYVERLADVKLYFWPVPNQAYTLKYRRQRLIRDADSGTTMDLAPVWFDAVVYSMAHKMALANSIPLDTVMYLEKLAERYVLGARQDEHEGGGINFTLGDD